MALLARVLAACGSTLRTDRLALAELFREAGGADWRYRSKWGDPASDPCDDKWPGVVCDRGRVFALWVQCSALHAQRQCGVALTCADATRQ